MIRCCFPIEENLFDIGICSKNTLEVIVNLIPNVAIQTSFSFAEFQHIPQGKMMIQA